MKKLNLLFVSIFIACSTSYAQQLPQLSQYMINDFAINPAIAGMYDNYQIKTSVKNQNIELTREINSWPALNPIYEESIEFEGVSVCVLPSSNKPH